jgi:hypothetical protein
MILACVSCISGTLVLGYTLCWSTRKLTAPICFELQFSQMRRAKSFTDTTFAELELAINTLRKRKSVSHSAQRTFHSNHWFQSRPSVADLLSTLNSVLNRSMLLLSLTKLLKLNSHKLFPTVLSSSTYSLLYLFTLTQYHVTQFVIAV